MNTTTRWALVTGASSGIGAAVARRLASDGYSLLLVARRADRLASLESDLKTQFPAIETAYEAIDLSNIDAVATLSSAIARRGIRINCLINNAGVGAFGEFTTTGLSAQLAMIDLNCRRLVELTHAIAQNMAKGDIIVHTASIGAFNPAPYFGVYAATKAFVLSFSEAIGFELASKGVQVVTLCPGPTTTEFNQVAGYQSRPEGGMPTQTPDEVADELMAGLRGNRALIITGAANRRRLRFMQIMPRRLVVALSGRVVKR